MEGFKISNYSVLTRYTVLSGDDATGLTIDAPALPASTTISYMDVSPPVPQPGNYGATNNAINITGDVIGTQLDVDVVNAQGQLSDLLRDIDNYSRSLPSDNIGSAPTGNKTFQPTTLSYSETSITFDDVTLTFDGYNSATGLNDPTSQFFIIARNGTITFTDVIINIINGANPGNIFFVALGSGGSITVTGVPTINGNLMAKTAITITGTGTQTVEGRIYANDGDVTLTEVLSVTGRGAEFSPPNPSFNINKNPLYSNLNAYGIFVGDEMTAVAPSTITVENGRYGVYAPISNPIIGNFVGTGSPSGFYNQNAAEAGIELVTLISNLQTFIVNAPTYNTFTLESIAVVNSGGGFTYTLYPNITYTTDAELEFGPNDIINFVVSAAGQQFFINSEYRLTFTNPTVNFNSSGFFDVNIVQYFIEAFQIRIDGFTSDGQVLINPEYIYWLSNDDIVIFNVDINNMYGTLVGTSVMGFRNSSTFTGRIYSTEGTFINLEGDMYITVVPPSGPVPPPPPPPPTPSGPVPCYAKGTLIFTQDGYVPIETLKAKSKVIIKGYINHTFYTSSKMKNKTIDWIGKFTIDAKHPDSCPVCISKGALGDNLPFQDLYVSPEHKMIINGVPVKAKSLLNGTTIKQKYEQEKVEYYHLELDSHCAILANGLQSESYFNTGKGLSAIFELSKKYKSNPLITSWHKQRSFFKQ